jgi:hypothetical protein
MDQLLRYAGGKLIQYHYTLPFRAGIATCVIEVKIPQLTTSDPRSIDGAHVLDRSRQQAVVIVLSTMDQGSVLVATWNTLLFPQHNQKLSHL